MKIASRVAMACFVLAVLAPPAFAAGGGIVHLMMLLALQLGAILFAAKLLAAAFEKLLKLPGVLGELSAGMLIGPFALGKIPLPLIHGPLFPNPPALPHGLEWPVSVELYGIATLASIVLLFLIGLETDFKMFFKFFVPGTVVGIGGVVGSFVVGDWITVVLSERYLGEQLTFMDPRALFMGTISTATSVGITARVLSEKRKLDSPEGTTILAGAVIDDVLGIIILAIVIGISMGSGGDGHVGEAAAETDWGAIGMVAAKAVGFWLGATAIGLLTSKWIARFLEWVPSPGATLALGFGCALLLAGLAESFKLAMIIGAYIMGLSLSKEPIKHELERDMTPVYHCLVPIFFAVMGMLVDFEKMIPLWKFGLIYTALAIVAKVVVGGLPVLAVGFNMRGAWRVGFGMLPRGEVALIVAGVGLASGAIGDGLFGVSIMMTIITTIVAPPILVWLFKSEASGLRKPPEVAFPELEKTFTIPDIDHATRQLIMASFTKAFEEQGYHSQLVSVRAEVYELEKDDIHVNMDADANAVYVHTQPHHQKAVKQILDDALEGMRKHVAGIEIHAERTVRRERKED